MSECGRYRSRTVPNQDLSKVQSPKSKKLKVQGRVGLIAGTQTLGRWTWTLDLLRQKSKVGLADRRHSDLGHWTLDVGLSQLGSAAEDAAKNGAKPVVAAALVVTIAGILPIALFIATHEAFTKSLR